MHHLTNMNLGHLRPINVFINGALKKVSVDLRPIPKPMSQSCLEVEVPTEAIEEMVTSPTCNEAFQHLKGGTEDRSREIW